VDSIQLINFQGFSNQTFNLKPLTLLSGLNGTGKTSVLQSLLLLEQSYDLDCLPEGCSLLNGLLLNGELVSVGTVGDVLFDRAPEDATMAILTVTNGYTHQWRFSTWRKDLQVYPLVSFAAQAMPWQIHYLSSCTTGQRIDFGLLETALPGSIVLIEHPEFGLHGSLATVAARQMAQAAARGVQILVETHCDHILNGIRVAIHQGELSSEHFNCLHFAQQPGLPVEIQEILFDRRGRSHTWPEHFFDEWDKSLEQLLDPIQP
jgi:AAA domain/Protein of unknown function (DUF3696)